MSTSKTRANRRRLQAKLRQLAHDFELQQVQSGLVNNTNPNVTNAFQIMQGKKCKTKLQKNSKWLWYNNYYTNRKEFNASKYGCNTMGNPLKGSTVYGIKVTKCVKVIKPKIKALTDNYTHEQIAYYHYKKMYS